MIILEGNDAIGKSTIAKLLSSSLGYDVIHNKKPIDGWFSYAKQSHINNKNIIFDRFHIGEMVWPVVFEDGRKPMLVWQQHLIERLLLTKQTILVRLTDEVSTINRRLKIRGEQELEPLELVKRENLFTDAIQHSILPAITIDNKFKTISDTCDTIMGFYRDAIYKYNKLSLYKSSYPIGYEEPIMIIGSKDTANKNIFDNQYNPLCRHQDKKLHLAMHLSGSNNFYLTLFKKTGKRSTDYDALYNEIALVKPKKIICVDEPCFILIKNLFHNIEIINPSGKLPINDYAKFFKQ